MRLNTIDSERKRRMIQDSYLIAGGAGFIGNHLVRKLLSYNNVTSIVVVDNFVTGNTKNLSDLKEDSRLKIINCDITKDMPEMSSFDVVIHLAAIANPVQYEENPISTLLVNSRGNENLLRIAKESKSSYFYFSSSEVYGNHNPMSHNGLKEETVSHLVLNQKRSPYFVGKAFGEEIVRNICTKEKINYLIIRPFNVYGSKMDRNAGYGRVIPNFITWAREKLPLQIRGDGTQMRAFCYIDDFIDAVISVLEHPNPPERLVNIGNPEPISILRLADMINKILNNPVPHIFTDRYEFEPKYRIPNIERISNWCGWEPKIKQKEGLRKTIESFEVDEEYGNI
ncbi:MAG: NAD-dependent epimerase/dehydratase family protein [Euryarchaeota archaeon]|nr:NAD-dependent epimerase/dehydratase family protein [Euryarchaeota archaeon]